MSADAVDEAVRRVEGRRPDLGMAVQAAADALTAGEGTEMIHQAALQQFLWWFLPRRYPEDEWDGMADATAELLDELGMGRLAGIARSGQTAVVLDAWTERPDIGASAFRAAHEDSGVDPPDTPLLVWGSMMGVEEVRARDAVERALADAIEAGHLVPGASRWRVKAAATTQDVLGRPLDLRPGQTLAGLVTTERIGTWIDSARHPLHQEWRSWVANRLLNRIEPPADPSKCVEPMRWLLGLASDGGAELTQSNYLARATVGDIQYKGVMPTTSELISSFGSSCGPEQATRFARAMVRRAAPSSPSRAKVLLFAVARLATFAISVGLETSPEVIFHPCVIERFIACGTDDFSSATRRTLRSNLRFVALRVVRSGSPAAMPLSREHAKAPYSDAEIAAYLALSRSQPTLARRMHGVGLICLGAGAGLMGADLRHVTGHDVVCRSGGVLVCVSGKRPRMVLVLASYHEALVESSRFAQDRYVIGGENPQRRNVTTPLVSATSGGIDLGRLDIGRLRSTWLRDCAKNIGLATFMAAAGISCSQRLGDIVADLPVADEAAAVALLGARP